MEWYILGDIIDDNTRSVLSSFTSDHNRPYGYFHSPAPEVPGKHEHEL
jgi:hypothetical protein